MRQVDPRQMVSEGEDPLTRRAILYGGETSCRILWRKKGVGSPALLRVQMSRLGKDGNLTFGREVAAGGLAIEFGDAARESGSSGQLRRGSAARL
jgi:hypothetical protein